MPIHPLFPPHIESFENLRSASGTRVFFSPDRYLLFSLKRSILSTAATVGVECAVYDAGEPGQARDAFGAAREIGFFGTRKIIVLDYAEALFPKERSSSNHEPAPQQETKEKKTSSLVTLLEEAINNPDPENLLIILFNELDRRTKLFGLMNKKNLFRELKMPNASDIRSFVQKLFGEVHPADDLVDYFLKEEQCDLFFIENEVAKLKLWAESQGLTTLSLAQAEPLLSSLADEVVFQITKYLVAGKKEKAISLFRDLRISEGDAKLFPILILLFQRHFRVILDGKVLIKTKRENQIPAMLAANKAFYLTDCYQKVIKRYKNRTIVEALREAAKLELGMKGVYGIAIPDVALAIEQFMVRYF